MHGSAKVEVEPIMPAWHGRGLPTNATPAQVPDSESSSEGYQDIVQVLQDYDARELDDSTKFEVKVKGYSRKPLSFWRGIGVSSFTFSVIEEGYKLSYFPFLPLLRTIDQRWNVQNLLRVRYKCFVSLATLFGVPLYVVNPLSVSVHANGKKRLILDLRCVNRNLPKKRTKHENWKVALSHMF